MLLTASSDIRFHAWPINTDLDKVYRPPEQSKVIGLSLSSDDRYLTYVTSSGRADIVNYKEREDIKFVHAITALGDVSCASFQKNTKKNIAIGTRTAQLALYDTRNKAVTKLFPGIHAPINYVDFNVDDQLLGVALENGSILVYENNHAAETPPKAHYVLSRTCMPTALRFHPKQANILSASTDEGIVMLWDTCTSRKIFSTQTHCSPVSGIAWAETSDLIVTVGKDNKICIHDLSIRECVFRSNLQRPLTAVDVSPDGTTVAIGAEDGLVHMYDLRNLLQPVGIFQAHQAPITKVLFENTIVDSPPHEDNIADPLSSKTKLQELAFSVYKPKSNISKLLKDSYYMVETISSHSMPKTATIDDNFNLTTFKNSILKTVQKETNHVRHQMLCQMNHLQNFIHNEFKKMETQMDDKWEVLNIASYVAKSNIEETMYEDSRTDFSESPEENIV